MATGPNFHHLRNFWIVAQKGSLVAASRELGVRHSTLSAQLRALESSLGVPLLLRRPRGVRLTPQGEIVWGYCDQIFRLGAELVEATSGQRAARLRVGMLASVARSLLIEALQPVFDGDKTIRIEITVTDIEAMTRLLTAGELHVVISDRLPATDSSGPVYSHLVGESRIGLYATRTLADRYRTGFPKSLDSAPMFLPTAGSPLSEALATWFAEEGIRPRIVGELDDVPTMKGFASRGHGIVPVRQAMAQETRRRYGLVQVGTVPGYADRLYALTLGRRVRHPGVQRLIEHCREKLGRP